MDSETPKAAVYVLTADEEEEIISLAKRQAIEHLKWKMKQLKFNTDDAIQSKIKSIDWEKKINRENLLKIANSNKLQELWQKECLKKEIEEDLKQKEEIKTFWTSNAFFRLMKTESEKRGKELIVNEDTKKLIKTICYFMAEDERFETELNFSFKKGLLLRGICGLGKTYLFDLIKANEYKPVKIISMIEIAETVKEEGEFVIQLEVNKLYLDDVGSEEAVVNHYGTKINWFKNQMELFYSNNFPFSRLLLSTNCSFQDLEDKYGYRLRSRFKEMFNVVDVTGKDLRGC